MWTPVQLLSVLLVSASMATASSAPDLLEDIWERGFQQDGIVGAMFMPRQTRNLQTFTGALGGIKADAVTQSGDSQRPFEVGGDTFTSFTDAAGRSCDNQKNNCATMANNGSATFSVSDCDSQNTQCHSAISKEAVAVSAQLSSGTSTSTSTSTSSSSSFSSSSSTSTSTSTSSTSTSISTTPVAAPPAVATSTPPVSVETTTAPPTSSVAVASTTSSATLSLVSQNAEFNFFCEV